MSTEIKDEPLGEKVFPLEQNRESLIVQGLGTCCLDCMPQRLKMASEMAMWSKRIGLVETILRIEGALPCDHLEDSSQIETAVANVVAKQREVTIELP